jgi:hypothetical protein
MNKIKEMIVAFVGYVLSNFDDNIQAAIKTLQIDVKNDDVFQPVYTLLHTMSQNYIVPIAVNIVLVVFMIEFIQLTLKYETVKIEFLFKALFKFLIAKYALDISFDLLTDIYTAGNELIVNVMIDEEMKKNIVFGKTLSGLIGEAMDKMTWYEAIGFLGTMVISFIVMFAAGFIVRVMAYVRVFDILPGMTFFALPCAFFGLGGSRIAKNFVIEFCGTCLQGTVMLVSIMMYGKVSAGLIGDWSLGNVPNADIGQRMASMMGLSGAMLLAILILIMMIVKSGSYAKSILKT